MVAIAYTLEGEQYFTTAELFLVKGLFFMRIPSPFVRTCVRIGIFGLFVLLLTACGTTGGGQTQPPATSPQTGVTTTPTAAPTSTPATSPSATAQPVATVASGTITENLLLTCGANCNDPIRVTITTIQVDDANGNMIWNISLKNVTGNSVTYGVATFELLANGAQTQVPASFAQPGGTLTNSDPYNIQGIFAFVPTQNTTYQLTAVFNENGGNLGGGVTITFDPTQITNL